jgi:hypothetical protein
MEWKTFLSPKSPVCMIAVLLFLGIPDTFFASQIIQDGVDQQVSETQKKTPDSVETRSEKSEVTKEKIDAVDDAQKIDPTIQSWINDLGSDSWEKRESAAQNLLKKGAVVRSYLVKALKNQDLEIRSKAEELISDLDNPVTEETRDLGKGATLRRKVLIGPGGVVTIELGEGELSKSKVDITDLIRPRNDLRTPPSLRPGRRSFEGHRDKVIELARMQRELSKDSRFPISRPSLIDKMFRESPSRSGSGLSTSFSGSRTSWGASESHQTEILNGEVVLEIQRDGQRLRVEPMGFELEEVHPGLKSHLPGLENANYMIRSIREDSLAQRLGFKVWDIFLKSDDQNIEDNSHLADAFRQPLKPLKFQVMREGKSVILSTQISHEKTNK